jgi:hypothetical protein
VGASASWTGVGLLVVWDQYRRLYARHLYEGCGIYEPERPALNRREIKRWTNNVREGEKTRRTLEKYLNAKHVAVSLSTSLRMGFKCFLESVPSTSYDYDTMYLHDSKKSTPPRRSCAITTSRLTRSLLEIR